MLEMDITQFFINNMVAVTVLAWFMFRMENIVKNNTSALQEMKKSINQCNKK